MTEAKEKVKSDVQLDGKTMQPVETAKNSKANIAALKTQLTDMQSMALAKAKDSSMNPVRVSYESYDVPQSLKSYGAKGYSVNLETDKTVVTFYRDTVEQLVTKVLQIDIEDFAELMRWIAKEKLFGVYNLFVREVCQKHKNVFFS